MARIVQDLAAPFGVEYGDDDGKTKNNEISGSGQEGKKALFNGSCQDEQIDHSESEKNNDTDIACSKNTGDKKSGEANDCKNGLKIHEICDDPCDDPDV